MMPEHLSSNPHAHGALVLPAPYRGLLEEGEVQEPLQFIYRKFTPSGTVKASRISNPSGWWAYMSKTARGGGYRVWMASEFHSLKGTSSRVKQQQISRGLHGNGKWVGRRGLIHRLHRQQSPEGPTMSGLAAAFPAGRHHCPFPRGLGWV